MAALDMRKMSQALKVTTGWLMMTGDYYARLNRGEFKCVLVEGKTDQKFLERGSGQGTKVHAVSEVFRNQDLLRQDYAARRPGTSGAEAQKTGTASVNAKGAVMDILYAVKMADFLNGPRSAADWQLYGVVDSDYDAGKPFSIPPNLTKNLFRTDTHDIETLLLSTDPELPLRMLDGFFDEEDVRKAFVLAGQMGKLRMSIYENAENISVMTPEGEQTPLRLMIRNRLHGMPDDDIDLFVREGEIDISLMIAYACGLVQETSDYKGLSEKSLKTLIKDVLKDRTIMRSLAKDKKHWKIRWDSFEPDADFWNMTQGHDIARFLRYVTKDKQDRLSSAQMQELKNTEFTVVDQYHLPCFSKSVLGGNLIEAGVWTAE